MNAPSKRNTCLTVLGTAVLALAAAPSGAPQEDSEFASATIDLGVVVSDLEESVAFYTQVIGFTEVPGFTVDGDFCSGAGLTDGHALAVRVLVLQQAEGATRLKLMALPETKPRAGDNRFVHSQLGYSYITIRAKSLRPALSRLAAAGGAVLAKGPVPLPGAGADGPHLALVADPDGNLVELIGPR